MSDNEPMIEEPDDLVTEEDREPEVMFSLDDDIDVPDDIVAPEGYGTVPPWEA